MGAEMTSAHARVPADDVPRRIVSRVSTGDKVFRGLMRAAGISVLVILAMILVFLGSRGFSALRTMGFRFFTTSTFYVGSNQFGIASMVTDGLIVAFIALIIAVPVAVGTALFISEWAPPALRRPLIALIDLMAAIPSIVYAMFGFFLVQPHIIGFESWLARHLGFIPFFHAPKEDLVSPSAFTDAPFIAGVIVSLMVIPIITSLSREVFSQAPAGEREAAYALGATRLGMVRTVVVPFGRAGIIGSSMLGLGRAFGEAIVVSFILTPILTINWHVLLSGGNSIPLMIVLHYTDGSKTLAALMMAGLVLFAITLVINVLGSIVTGRSRSGAITID